MGFSIEWRARKMLSLLACFSLAFWCAMEWLASRPSFILNPFGLLAYFGSVSLCLGLSIVLFVLSPRRRLLTEERIAAVALLLPLLWNLL